MAALLSENSLQHNGNLPTQSDASGSALMRDELPSSFVRLLAYLGAVALPSVAAAQVSQLPKVMSAITPVHDAQWMEVERLVPAFVLSILEAADMPASYAIRRHAEGSRRDPILAATPKYHLLWKAGANRPEPRRTGR